MRAVRAKKKAAEIAEDVARRRAAQQDAAGGAANLSSMMNEMQLVPQSGGRCGMRHAPCSCVDSPGDASHDIVIAGLHPRYGDDEPSLEGGGADRPEDFVLCDGDDEPCLECGGTDRPDDFVLCDGCDQGGHVNCVGLTSVPEGNWFCGRCEAPSGPGAADTRTAGLRAHAATLAEQYTLIDLAESSGGPARYKRVSETGQKLGFITPLSHNFCESCNRVRLTCTGQLYQCLGQEGMVDLRQVLRDNPNDYGVVITKIHDAIALKPKGHDFDYSRQTVSGQMSRHMSHTGG